MIFSTFPLFFIGGIFFVGADLFNFIGGILKFKKGGKYLQEDMQIFEAHD